MKKNHAIKPAHLIIPPLKKGSLHIDMKEPKVWKAKKNVVPNGYFDVSKFKCWMTGASN